MLRVIHISHSSCNGGAAIAANRLHRALLMDNVSSEMWVLRGDKETPGLKVLRARWWKTLERVVTKRIARAAGKALHSGSYISLAIVDSGLSRLINESSADVVHLHWIQGEMMSIKEIGQIRKPIVWTLHDNWPLLGCEHHPEGQRDAKGTMHYDCFKRTSFLSDWCRKRKAKYWSSRYCLICPSEWMYQNAASCEIFGGSDIYKVGNIVNVEVFRDRGTRVERRATRILIVTNYGLAEQGKVGVSLNRVAEVVKEIGDGCRLVVSGITRRDEREYLESLEVESQGRIKGELGMAALYNSVDIVLCTSLLESFGLVAAEAAACGCLVIANGGTGTAEIVEDGVTGYIYSYEEELLSLLRVILKDREKIRRMGVKGAKRANIYRTDMTVNKHKEVYAAAIVNTGYSEFKEYCSP